ncbi:MULTISPECIES: hypothetical protein [unclassified Methanoculleus]|uniref:hypothetical protein n=1 Tax=unclassified Methanoculleus TaxID=2619537 RepID=UPI0025CCB999|nr:MULTISPECIES: hypothetical protein [unclassified Methanoculleus]
MSGKIGMQAFSVPLAVLLVGVMVVPAMAADAGAPDIEKLDIVDAAALQERSPSFISELRSEGCSEEEIAEAIRSLPRVSYLDGWTEADDRRVSPLLQQARDELNYSMHGGIDLPTGVRASGPGHIDTPLTEPGSQADAAVVARSNPGAARTILYPSGGLRDQEPAASAAKLQSSQPVFTGPGIEDLKAALNRREPVTVTLGGLPSSKGGKGIALSGFTAATKDLIRERYLYPNGSLIGYGHDIDGYLRVGIWNGPPPPENVSSIDAVYAMLDTRAREMGIEDIPVKFTVFISPPELAIGPRMDSSAWTRLCGAT